MARKTHRPPSRVRYEKENPVISIRVPRELYIRLRALKAVSGKSLADVLREGLGIQEATVKGVHTRGFNKGYAEAEKRYRVDYQCSICGGDSYHRFR